MTANISRCNPHGTFGESPRGSTTGTFSGIGSVWLYIWTDYRHRWRTTWTRAGHIATKYRISVVKKRRGLTSCLPDIPSLNLGRRVLFSHYTLLWGITGSSQT